jgi:hypothetical protein
MGWDHVAPLGKADAGGGANNLGEAAIASSVLSWCSEPSGFSHTIAKRGYRVPLGDRPYVWGSNSGVC